MKIIVFVFTLAFFISCKKETISTDVDITVSLDNCAEQTSDTVQYRLCFDSLLEDSRCAINTNCVWQGAAKAKFRFMVGSQEHVVRLSTIDMAPYYSTDTTVAGYHLKLINILPYPVYPNNPQTPITATVKITQ